jgi:glycosyltransferase involved in cell wall biosynthesis
MKKVSIITPVKNGALYIKTCIESVLNQDYENIEHIIIDGNSSDSTMDIIKSYGAKVSYSKSSNDKNMYAAINTGLSIASGDIIACLNSDDYYYNSNIISLAVKHINKGNKAIYGNIIKYYQITNTFRYVKLYQIDYTSLLMSRHSTFLPQPTLFMIKDLYKKYNNFQDNYYFSSDYDFILKVLKDNKIKHIDSFFTVFRQHGDSITSNLRNSMLSETSKILRDNNYQSYSIYSKILCYLKGWLYYKYINIPQNLVKNSSKRSDQLI